MFFRYSQAVDRELLIAVHSLLSKIIMTESILQMFWSSKRFTGGYFHRS